MDELDVRQDSNSMPIPLQISIRSKTNDTMNTRIHALLFASCIALSTSCSSPPRHQSAEVEASGLQTVVSSPLAANRGSIAIPCREFTIPSTLVRGFLPADGEILSEVMKENVWPDERGAFFKNEMAEFTLGRAIRAQRSDRAAEKSLSPSVLFRDGHLAFRAGWRVHKKIPIHNDFFDGTANGKLIIAYAAGTTVFDASLAIDWNESMISSALLDLGDAIEDAITGKIAITLENEIEKKVPKEVSNRVDELLKENKLPIGLRDFVMADVQSSGIRVRLYDHPLIVHKVKIPSYNFRLSKSGAGGDGKFAGNGPNVDIESNISLEGSSLSLEFRMTAKETKENWTKGVGTQRKPVFTIPSDEILVDVVGGMNHNILSGYRMNGNSPLKYRSLYGTLEIVGDTQHANDVPSHSGFKTLKTSELVIITMKK